MIFHAEKLTKIYQGGRAILSNVSLEVKQGQSLAIMGPSGVGKSTLLHILGTIDEATSGSLYLNGKKITSRDREAFRRFSCGFVFQMFFLMESLSAMDNVMIPAKLAHTFKKKRDARALHLLEMCGVENRATTQAKFLSGGEKQRIAIARALCNDPPLLLADEPTGNLDEYHSQKIQTLLLQTVKQQKKGLIVVTHDLSFAEKCDHILYLKNGILSKEQDHVCVF